MGVIKKKTLFLKWIHGKQPHLTYKLSSK